MIREVFFLSFLALGGCAAGAGAIDAASGKPSSPASHGYTGGLSELLYVLAYAAVREVAPRVYGAVKKKVEA